MSLFLNNYTEVDLTRAATQEAAYIAPLRAAAKEKLGTKYLCHPSNQVKRLTPFTPDPVQGRLENFG